MSLARKLKKKRLKPEVKRLTKIADKYQQNRLRATKEVTRRWNEVKGFVLKRFATNTLWVLRKNFKFSRRLFDKFNNGIMEMSEIQHWDKTVDVAGFIATLFEECKFKYTPREPYDPDIEEILQKENAMELVSYETMFNSVATNLAMPIYYKWEIMMLWVLHVYMGFGKVRLARFQAEMKKLWTIDNGEALRMLETVKKEVGIDRVGTGIVYLPAMI